MVYSLQYSRIVQHCRPSLKKKVPRAQNASDPSLESDAGSLTWQTESSRDCCYNKQQERNKLPDNQLPKLAICSEESFFILFTLMQKHALGPERSSAIPACRLVATFPVFLFFVKIPLFLNLFSILRLFSTFLRLHFRLLQLSCLHGSCYQGR